MLPLVIYHVLHVVDIDHMPPRVQEVVMNVLEAKNIQPMILVYNCIIVKNVTLDNIHLVGTAKIVIPALTRQKLTSLAHLVLLGNQALVLVQPQQIIVLIVKPVLIPN